MKLYKTEYQDASGTIERMIVMAEDISTADRITKAEAGKRVDVLSVKETGMRAITQVEYRNYLNIKEN